MAKKTIKLKQDKKSCIDGKRTLTFKGIEFEEVSENEYDKAKDRDEDRISCYGNKGKWNGFLPVRKRCKKCGQVVKE